MPTNTPSDNETVHFVATAQGRVQGVGYRAFVVRKARRLGVTGSVRNVRDGTVEVLAFARRPVLDELILELERGPAASRVDTLAVRWRDAADVPTSFKVVR